jgi:hypothetical protein
MSEKIYFAPGDLVRVKGLNISPVMKVRKVNRATFEKKENSYLNNLLGIRCFWFSDHGLYQEQLFDFKDLEKC